MHFVLRTKTLRPLTIVSTQALFRALRTICSLLRDRRFSDNPDERRNTQAPRRSESDVYKLYPLRSAKRDTKAATHTCLCASVT